MGKLPYWEGFLRRVRPGRTPANGTLDHARASQSAGGKARRAPDSAWVSVRDDVRRLETRALTTVVFLLEFLLVGLDGN